MFYIHICFLDNFYVHEIVGLFIFYIVRILEIYSVIVKETNFVSEFSY